MGRAPLEEDAAPARLLAGVEPAWSEDGLLSPCVHVLVEGAGADGAAAAVAALVGAHLTEALPAPASERLLRLEPSIGLPTLAALLRRAGWTVGEVEGGGLEATRGGEGP